MRGNECTCNFDGDHVHYCHGTGICLPLFSHMFEAMCKRATLVVQPSLLRSPVMP